MSFVRFYTLVAFMCLCGGCLCTAPPSDCNRSKSGNNQYTWNFVLPGSHGLQVKALADLAAINDDNSDLTNLTDTITKSLSPRDVKCPECPKKEPGIYWREYKGVIPHDAIVGGHYVGDSGPVPIYLGQAYLQTEMGGLQPGQLFNESASMTAVFKGLHEINTNIKVLCGPQEEVTWLPWADAVNLAPATDFVNAGFERTWNVYFARSRHNGKRYIGKVVPQHKLMYLPYAGKESALRTFEVLCYTDSLLEKGINIPVNQLQ